MEKSSTAKNLSRNSIGNRAYDDRPLPIGYDQTISQPYIVAFMTEKLDPQPTDRVLENRDRVRVIRPRYSPSLWRRSIPSKFIEPLAQRAEADLKRLGYTNIHVRAGDGLPGLAGSRAVDATHRHLRSGKSAATARRTTQERRAG